MSNNNAMKGNAPNFISEVSNLGRLSASKIDQIAAQVGEDWNKRRVKTNQLRNIYGYISSARNLYDKANRSSQGKTLEDVKIKLIFLKPRLAYIAGRKTEVKDARIFDFYKNAIVGIEKASDEQLSETLKKFFDLSEAIIAYHKYYEK